MCTVWCVVCGVCAVRSYTPHAHHMPTACPPHTRASSVRACMVCRMVCRMGCAWCVHGACMGACMVCAWVRACMVPPSLGVRMSHRALPSRRDVKPTLSELSAFGTWLGLGLGSVLKVGARVGASVGG